MGQTTAKAAQGSASNALVLIPAFNEVATVGGIVALVSASGYPVAVVDDGSTDGTAGSARRAGATVLQLPVNLGVGGALRCGFRWAVARGYSTVIQCDADGQHDPEQIGYLLTVAERVGADLTIGTRFSGGKGFEATRLRRMAIRQLARVASRACGTPITDPSSGFRVIREPLLSEFAREYGSHYLADTFGALYESGRAGFTVLEVPVVMRARAGGVPSAGSLASVRYLFRALLTVLLGSGHRYSLPLVGSAESQ